MGDNVGTDTAAAVAGNPAQSAQKKNGRSKSYSPTQMAIILSGKEKGYGPKTIIGNNKDAGLTFEGAKMVLRRLRKSGSDDVSRKSGSGRKRSARTDENVEKVRRIIDGDSGTSLKQLSKETGLSRTAVQTIVKQDLKLKSYSKVKMQRAQEKPREKRLNLCTQWKARMEDGYELDPRRIFFADEKYFRLGQAPWGGPKLPRLSV